MAVIVLVIVLVAVVVAVVLVTGWWQGSGSFVPLWSLIGPLCMVFVIVIALIIAGVAGAFRPRASLPPPPPVQQPMVPAGFQGMTISLNCPSCGAPPVAIDRFGVATCTHCGTRFLVR